MNIINPQRAEAEFLKFLENRGESVQRLLPTAAVEAMIAFYREVRADGCDLAEDKDMLLFQWHAYESHTGAPFVYDITRQFIFGEDEDNDIWQLRLTFEFEAIEPLVAIGDGNRWCQSPDELEAFEEFVRTHAATMAVGRRFDSRARLGYGCAG